MASIGVVRGDAVGRRRQQEERGLSSKCAELWRASNGWKKHGARLGGDRVAQNVVDQWSNNMGRSSRKITLIGT